MAEDKPPARAAEERSPARASMTATEKPVAAPPPAAVPEEKPAEQAPADKAAWQRHTDVTMMKSRNQIREMLARCRANEIEEAANKAAAQEFAAQKQMEAKKEVMTRAAAHERVIDTSFRCMREIEDAILQMEDVAVKLKHERMAGFAALQVCSRRQDLREKRPKTETFADSLGEALSRERGLLEHARGEIFGLEGEAKKIIDDLLAMRTYLSADTGERRLEMAHDFSSLKVQVSAPSPKHKKRDGEEGQDELSPTLEGAADNAATSPEKPAAEKPAAEKPAEKPAAEKPAAEKPAAEKPAAEKPAAEKPAAEKPAEKPAAEKPAAEKPAAEKPAAEKPAGDKAAAAAPAEGEPTPAQKLESKLLIEETQKLLARCRNTCLRAFALIDRVKSDAARALGKVEEALSKRTADLAAKKKNLEMHALDVEAAIQVAERSLDRQQRRLDPKDTKKAAKLKADVEVLEQLRASRKALQDDIRSKFAALEIDNLCRRVTPAKADSAQREAAAKQQMTMVRVGSAPNLRKKDMGMSSSSFGRTGDFAESLDGSTMAPSSSPAGNSASLKAAGASSVQ